jgi:hypothetical protein
LNDHRWAAVVLSPSKFLYKFFGGFSISRNAEYQPPIEEGSFSVSVFHEMLNLFPAGMARVSSFVNYGFHEMLNFPFRDGTGQSLS